MASADGDGSSGARRAGAGFSLAGLRYQSVVALAGLAVVWQIASLFVPHYLFPSVPEIADRLLDIFTSWKSVGDALATSARILAGLAGAFVLGIVLALPMARSATFERYVYPLLNFNQGIPALSWVVIAIIWFRGIEFRIFFIMVMTTLPAFTFQVLDAYRAMSKDLFEMTLSFRPTRLDLFRTLIWPTVLPGILTAWKVNLGNASRVVVVAELVGATGGVGYQLLQQQQIFDMAGAIAWTLVLVIFVLVVQGIITLIENRALRYRAFAEHVL
ncbi:MAG TPA: ABC transporter permease subunit [Xanthobacteraceae bacterium]|nr:ABC transporter permease subunit [Xanthobacteraceae bacterium]